MDLNQEEVKEKALAASKETSNKKNDRKIVKPVRKTKEGKQIQEETEIQKKKNQALIKATLKEKADKNAAKGGDDSDWDSVEEDYQHIQPDELKSLEDQLAGMKIKGDHDGDSEDEKDDDFDQ